MKMKCAIWVAVLVACAVWVGAAGTKFELPREVDTFRTGPGMGLANARCLTCHSEDYVAIQPPMPRPFWKASVVKMQQKYGADIPEGEVEMLADYLSRVYGTEKLPPQPVVTPIIISEPGADGGRLVAKFGCVACHGVDRKIVGPAFREIAAKHRGTPDVYAKLTRQISLGGGGNWGPVPMPPFQHIPASDVRVIIDWILKQ